MQEESSVMFCPREMVGRVIGRSGETIRAIQLYTDATISINQRYDPSLVIIHGGAANVVLASQMVDDIIQGRFKGFALLRQAAARGSDSLRDLVTYVPLKGFLPKKRDMLVANNIIHQQPSSLSELGSTQLSAAANIHPSTQLNLSKLQLNSPQAGLLDLKSHTSELLAIQYMQKQLEYKRQLLLGKVVCGGDDLSCVGGSFTLSSCSSGSLLEANNTTSHLLPKYLIESLNEQYL
eukprot:TRINITY_DN278_c1_g1_i1.p3 TRINITY_DN278_c1_g1~~TRINITY_DN278_c1_g1_i1.p3  ORF type:complete len:236 (-),score=19.32 TRINITY_DN278_c1_g1_i1:1983-2690(-)